MGKAHSEEVKKLWQDRVNEQRNSGLSMAAWCRQKNIPAYTLLYWRDKFFAKTPLNRSSFTEIPSETSLKSPGITIECHGCYLHLSQGFDPLLLKKCLEVLKKC